MNNKVLIILACATFSLKGSDFVPAAIDRGMAGGGVICDPALASGTEFGPFASAPAGIEQQSDGKEGDNAPAPTSAVLSPLATGELASAQPLDSGQLPIAAPVEEPLSLPDFDLGASGDYRAVYAAAFAKAQAIFAEEGLVGKSVNGDERDLFPTSLNNKTQEQLRQFTSTYVMPKIDSLISQHDKAQSLQQRAFNKEIKAVQLSRDFSVTSEPVQTLLRDAQALRQEAANITPKEAIGTLVRLYKTLRGLGHAVYEEDEAQNPSYDAARAKKYFDETHLLGKPTEVRNAVKAELIRQFGYEDSLTQSEIDTIVAKAQLPLATVAQSYPDQAKLVTVRANGAASINPTDVHDLATHFRAFKNALNDIEPKDYPAHETRGLRVFSAIKDATTYVQAIEALTGRTYDASAVVVDAEVAGLADRHTKAATQLEEAAATMQATKAELETLLSQPHFNQDTVNDVKAKLREQTVRHHLLTREVMVLAACCNIQREAVKELKREFAPKPKSETPSGRTFSFGSLFGSSPSTEIVAPTSKPDVFAVFMGVAEKEAQTLHARLTKLSAAYMTGYVEGTGKQAACYANKPRIPLRKGRCYPTAGTEETEKAFAAQLAERTPLSAQRTMELSAPTFEKALRALVAPADADAFSAAKQRSLEEHHEIEAPAAVQTVAVPAGEALQALQDAATA